MGVRRRRQGNGNLEIALRFRLADRCTLRSEELLSAQECQGVFQALLKEERQERNEHSRVARINRSQNSKKSRSPTDRAIYQTFPQVKRWPAGAPCAIVRQAR